MLLTEQDFFIFTVLMRKVLLLVIAIALVSASYLSYKLFFKESIRTEAVNLIPTDAIFILEAEQPINNWKKFSSSDFWSFLKTHPYLSELNDDALYLDSFINENKLLLKHIGNRSFHMSAHMTNANDYDFLFIIDLKEASNFKLSLFLLQKMLDDEAFKASVLSYKSAEIFKIKDLEDGTNLYVVKNANFIACSYSLQLVKNSLDAKETDVLTKNKRYVDITKNVSTNGLARLYFNYEYLDDYLNIYTQGSEQIIQSLSSSFSFTGLDISLDENQVKMEGFTSLPDTVEQFSSLIQEFGNGPLQFQKVLSSRTASAQVIALNDFKSFYNRVLKLKQNDPETIQNYIDVKTKVEKALNLSLEEDLLSWIGNEAVIAQFETNKLTKHKDDYVAAIRANDIDDASEKLQNIQKHIKKRTPAKFRKMSYKTYDIFYLDIKGFFSLFFGKAFDKITKPYYTIIEDYVIFSNNPSSLIAMIEDYENGDVLANLPSFIKLRNEMPKEVALFTYLNGELAYNAATESIDKMELEQYKQNKKYFNFFKSIGIAYKAKGKGFKNVVTAHYGEKNDINLSPPPLIDSLESSYFDDYTTELKNLSEAETFVLNNIKDGKFTKYYKGTKLIQFVAQTKKGSLHGKFTEYYKNGKVRSEGKYRKGKKVGRWKYYNNIGVLTEKEWEGL